MGFGDYDRGTVQFELEDYLDHDVRRSNLKIITTGDDWASIEAAVAKLNLLERKLKMTTHRPGYHESLDWIVLNDDTEFLDDDDPSPSTTAALVADQFRKPIKRVIEDLLRRREDLFGPFFCA